MRGTVHQRGDPKPVAVEVRVEADAVVAEGDAGERFAIPIAEVTIAAGGFDGDHVFLRTPDDALTIATADPGIVPALEAIGDARLDEALAGVGRHRRAHATRRRLGIAVAVTAVAVLVLGAGAALVGAPRLLASSVDALPAEIDRQLGDAASGELSDAGPEITDPVVVGFVETIVARLEPRAATPGFDYRVRVIDSEQVNAFALPGGRVVVFTGLIRAADRPEQVAGVLAHEMAHVTLRHGMRNLAHRAGLLLAVSILLGDSSGWVELAADAAILAQQNDYSREQEAAADAEGVRMLMASGLDPGGLADFFRTLAAEPGGEPSAAMRWLSTHPDHASRIAHVEGLVDVLPAAPRRPLDVDWPAVRAAVGAR